MPRIQLHTIHFVFLVLAAPFFLSSRAHAQSDDLRVLEMLFNEDELVSTATRSPKPLSQAAENITIVTAAEIEAMNAHTLAEVLVNVPGVQVDVRGGPGESVAALVQGADFHHVLVMIDGVRINNLFEGAADLGAFPVQNIERIEVVKGPASSSWGPALGGVISVITKEPLESRPSSGMLSASIGTRGTGDFRGETAGSSGRFGYYLDAGRL